MTCKRKAHEMTDDSDNDGANEGVLRQNGGIANRTTGTPLHDIEHEEERVENHGLRQERGSVASRTEKGKKRKRLTNTDRLKQISMTCEWNMCTSVFKKMEDFNIHVTEHLKAEANSPPTGDGYLCLWRECGYVCSNKDELNRHVYFHAFHTKTKSVGALLLEESNTTCILDSSGRNMIPEIPEAFECMWEDCGEWYPSAQEFYWHVSNHVRSVDPVGNPGLYHCGWEGCASSFMVPNRLTDHTRSHTQEKVVGCPNCGGIYSSNTKFRDHCIRQIPLDSQQFQCSHCSRRYANERLLRDHVRHHINHYKCSQCDMTVPNKSTLAVHIRYRHSTVKPHKCLHCGRGCTSSMDLSRHLTSHSEEPAYLCPFQCNYKCRSASTLHRHLRSVHSGLSKYPYLCHMCDSKFTLGTMLTKHLVKEHNFLSPVGHTRFRYKQDEDGFYRLQTVRYESIESSQGTGDGGEEEDQEEGEEDKEADKMDKRDREVVDCNQDSLSSVPSSPASVTSSQATKELSIQDTWENQDPQKVSSKKRRRNSKHKTSESLEVSQEIILPSEF